MTAPLVSPVSVADTPEALLAKLVRLVPWCSDQAIADTVRAAVARDGQSCAGLVAYLVGGLRVAATEPRAALSDEVA